MKLGDLPLITDIIELGHKMTPPNLWPVYGSPTNLDRQQFVTASENTNCIRRIWFSKNVKSPPMGTWGWAERGHALEAWIVEKLALAQHMFDLRICYTGDKQVSFIDTDNRLSGTPDGIICVLKDDVYYLTVLELKTIDPRTNKNALPKSAHVQQTYQNIHLVTKHAESLVESKNVIVLGGVIVYVDASNLQDIQEFTIPVTGELFSTIEAVSSKAAKVFSAKHAKDLPAEGLYRDECKQCDHRVACSALVKEQQQTQDSVPSGEKTNAIRQSALKLFGQSQSSNGRTG